MKDICLLCFDRCKLSREPRKAAVRLCELKTVDDSGAAQNKHAIHRVSKQQNTLRKLHVVDTTLS